MVFMGVYKCLCGMSEICLLWYVGCDQRDNVALYFIIPLANKALCRHYGK